LGFPWGFPWVWVWDGYGDYDESPSVCGDSIEQPWDPGIINFPIPNPGIEGSGIAIHTCIRLDLI